MNVKSLKIKSAFFVASLILPLLSHAWTADGSNTFHAAKAYSVNGKTYDHIEITINNNSDLVVSGCNDCSDEIYAYQEKASQAIGKSVYKAGENDYIFEEKEGLFVWAEFPKGLGKSIWSKRNRYNILAKDRAYVRQLFTSTQMQNDIKKSLVNYSREVKKQKIQISKI